MRLLNTNNRLPGGWRYEQFDSANKPLHKWAGDFDPFIMFLGKVQSFRKANQLSRQDINFVEQDVTEYLAREFGGDPRYFTSSSAQKKTSHSPHSPSRSLARLADTGLSILRGASTIADWLGDGLKPVAQEVAQNRADICSGRLNGKPCLNNNPGFKPVETIAQIIRAWSEKKNYMTSEVMGEDNLHTCNVCLCHLPTKIFVPMKTILGQTSQAMLDKFASEAPRNCWMLSRK